MPDVEAAMTHPSPTLSTAEATVDPPVRRSRAGLLLVILGVVLGVAGGVVGIYFARDTPMGHTGRYATTPDPCSLVSADLATQYAPGETGIRQDRTAAEARCVWAEPGASTAGPERATLTVTVWQYGPEPGKDADTRARDTLKVLCDSNPNSRALPELGDGACQAGLRGPTDPTDAVVHFGRSNLTITVLYNADALAHPPAPEAMAATKALAAGISAKL